MPAHPLPLGQFFLRGELGAGWIGSVGDPFEDRLLGLEIGRGWVPLDGLSFAAPFNQ